MTTITPRGSGYRIDAMNGISFRNHAHRPFRPRVGLYFLSDKSRNRNIWLPYEEPHLAELDTGADVSCFGVETLLRFGIRENKQDTAEFVHGVHRKRVKARKKFVRVRVGSNPNTLPLLMEIRYSREFRPDLLLISWRWLQTYFDVFLRRNTTLLLW